MDWNKVWADFVDLFKASAIIQGIMAVGATFTMGYLFVTGKQVPDTLITLVMLILGYYFGSKTQQKLNTELTDYVTRYDKRIDGGADTTTK